MESIQSTKGNTKGAVIKFGKGKTTRAEAMTPAQDALYIAGEALGANTAENACDWTEALKACKTPADRIILRDGFISVYAPARSISTDGARKKFDRLAALHSPDTSRKAKSNKARAAGGGRKEKTGGKGETLAPQVTAQRLAAVLHYIAEAQAKHAGDGEMLEVLGDIARIAGGSK